MDSSVDAESIQVGSGSGSSSRWRFSMKTQRYITLGFVANTDLPLFWPCFRFRTLSQVRLPPPPPLNLGHPSLKILTGFFQRGWLLFTHWRTMVSRRNEKALRKSNELFLHLIAIEKQHCFVFINYNTLKADMVPMSCSRIPVLLSVYLWPASVRKSVMG